MSAPKASRIRIGTYAVKSVDSTTVLSTIQEQSFAVYAN
jgi:hypothetical protein